MLGVDNDGLKAFFAQSRTFDGERVLSESRSRRLAWRIAGVSAATGFASIVAVICMLPLRTVDVYVFRVNATTGTVDLVTPVRGIQTYDEAVTKYWLADYVRGREGYMFDEAPAAFRKVNLMSLEPEQAKFTENYALKNPKSALAVLGREGTSKIDIRAISFPSANLGLVRYARTVQRGGQTTVSHWMATVAYDYVSAPLSDADRLINPLGFSVRDYRIDPETP